ncbi:MAG: hypothetical protein JXR10_18005 [Cyclobacteriaceae bacterium]
MKSQIESELHRLGELIGAQPNQLPTIDNSRDSKPNISFSANGTAYYEAHERGNELFSFPAFDLEHLMFMAFKDITFSMAFEHERKNRNPNEDSRRQLFSKQIELLRTLNSEWAERTQKEIDATLRTAPFDDRLTTK